MSIIQRFKTIMASNVHSNLEIAENPEKMIDEYLRTLNHDLGKIKSETAAVMTAEKRAKRALDGVQSDINKMQRYAIKALEAGNEEDARKFLEKKAEHLENHQKYQAAYNSAASNTVQLKQMHEKLVGDIGELEARAATLKGKAVMATTQGNLNKIKSFGLLDQIEEKVDRSLEEANAMAELNNDPFEDLLHSQNQTESTTDVDHEIAELKKQIHNKE